MHKGSPPSRPGSSKPLKRGKACLTCRFLKIKCDGTRPICGPCERHPKDDPCEYADGPGRSRTRALEDTVSRLEARLREYENPNETPSISLHNPYGQPAEDNSLQLTVPLLPQLKGEPYSAHTSPSSPFSAISPHSSAPTPPPATTTTSSVRTSRSPGTESEEPTLPVIRNLLDTFFMHASTFGFFLQISRFYSAALLSLPLGDHQRPCPGLLNTIYLLGVHLSSTQSTDATRAREQTLLLRALRDTATELSTTHPHRYLHTIQAETLLSYYFFRTGNILEAKRHASSAASLVLGCGLHRLRPSSNAAWNSKPVAVGPSGLVSLPESKDPVEEGERINGFWAVFTLYRNLSVAVDSASDVCGVFDAPGLQVDTPWPLDMENYKEGILPLPGTSTVWNYLNHVQPSNDRLERSLNALIAKGSILLHQAVFLSGQYHSNMNEKDSQSFFAAFQSLNHLIESTRIQVPAFGPGLDVNSSSTRSLYLAHTLIQATTIKLHGVFSFSDPTSRQLCLDTAKTMLKGLSEGSIDVKQFGSVNPIMGTLWTIACQVLIEELVRVRANAFRGQAWNSTSGEVGGEEQLLSCLQEGYAALSFFGASSDLMKWQLTSIQGNH